MVTSLLISWTLCLASPVLVAVAAPPAQAADTTASSDASDDALRTILAQRATRSAELQRTRDQIATTSDPQQRQALSTRAAELQAEVEELTRKFDSFSSGVDVSLVEEPPNRPFDLVQELESLAQPLFQYLKSMTEGPRQIEQLRTDVALFEQRRDMATEAVLELQARLPDAGPQLRPELERALADWEARRNDFANRRDVAAFELRQRTNSRRSLVDSMGGFVNTFFRSKGLNLLLAVAGFLGVFALLRFVQRRFVDPIRVRRGVSFYARLTNVLFHLLTFVAALGAMIAILFSVSDWVLLVLVIIFLLGIGWASVNMLPQFFEQVRLLLNLGSVRENERVIFGGLPWRVESLRVYTTLSNPALTGGRLRLPIQELLGLHSRPQGHDEPWFPCAEGDWVILDDGVRGRVLVQTPDVVSLDLPGGGAKTYQTATFLGQNPRNLSKGYRARIVFGIDYSHQATSTEDIPERMKARLEERITEVVDREHVRKITLELRQAGASSLDYEVQVDLDGAAASRYEDVHRRLSRILVDACNENDWTIPFTQVTIHQAA